MEYESRLIHVKNSLELSEGMYALICLRASGLSMTLSGVRCFLDGAYLLCLSQDDRLTVHALDQSFAEGIEDTEFQKQLLQMQEGGKKC